jgi:hypothetical protein
MNAYISEQNIRLNDVIGGFEWKGGSCGTRFQEINF